MINKVIIDTDLGADDYIAIQLALLSKNIKIEGISLVYGNTTMENIKKNIFKTLDMINMNNNVKIYEGNKKPIKEYNVNTKDNAFGLNGFSDVKFDEVKGIIEKDDAIDWMIKTVNENINEITIVAIGPLTNIANAIIKDNDFAKNVKEIIIMGGDLYGGNITKHAEFNFYNDPLAAKIVFESGIKNIIMIGFNVTKKVILTPDLEKKLLSLNNKNAKFIYDITRLAAKIDTEKSNTNGAIISDALNICYLLDKNVLKLEKAHIKIITDNNKYLGASIIDVNKKPNCLVATDVDNKRCMDMIFRAILKEDFK